MKKTYTTPFGRAIYPWLQEPDYKFDPKGRYHVVDDISETNETIHIVEDVASFGSELGVALFNIHNSTGASIIVSNSNMERV